MENLGEVLRACGLGFAHTMNSQSCSPTCAEWARVQRGYLEYFDPARLPARSTFGASGLAQGGQIEVECVGDRPRER